MHEKNKRPAAGRPELSKLELAVMTVVWELGECSSAEAIAAFRRRRKLAPTTIKTVLANLRKKGYLEPMPTIERGLRLRPTVSRASVAKRSLRELLASLFQGSPQQAIAHLLKEEDLSDDDMAEIRRILDSRTGGKGSR